MLKEHFFDYLGGLTIKLVTFKNTLFIDAVKLIN